MCHSSTMDNRKRKRVEVDPSEFTLEELECAEALHSLSSSSLTSTRSSSSSSSPSSSSTFETQPSHSETRDELPSHESIIGKFEHHDPCYGTKYLAVDKPLTSTDVNRKQMRLGIPNAKLDAQVRETFLTQQERDELEKKGHIPVKVRGCFSEKEHDMALGKWYYKSKKGFKYALIDGWNDFRDENGLECDDKVTVAAVRSGGALCFAIHGGRRKQPAATVPVARCWLTWQRTLPRGAKGGAFGGTRGARVKCLRNLEISRSRRDICKLHDEICISSGNIVVYSATRKRSTSSLWIICMNAMW